MSGIQMLLTWASKKNSNQRGSQQAHGHNYSIIERKSLKFLFAKTHIGNKPCMWLNLCSG